MVTAQSLVNTIKAHSVTPDTLVENLKQLESSLSNQGLVMQALQALDPVQHSLGYLYLLCVPGLCRQEISLLPLHYWPRSRPATA